MTVEEMNQWIQEYGSDIYRFCCHLTGCRQSADDLYQDTFVKAVQLRQKVPPSDKMKSYLIGIAVNLWRNQYRKEKRRREIAPEAGLDENTICSVETADVLEQYIQKELAEAVLEVVRKLPEKMRVAVLMYYTEDMSVAEIAETLHTPKGTIMSRLYKARIKIKEDLEVKGYEL